jgi:transketolase
MGMVDVATALFHDHLMFDPADPAWPDGNRFVPLRSVGLG